MGIQGHGSWRRNMAAVWSVLLALEGDQVVALLEICCATNVRFDQLEQVVTLVEGLLLQLMGELLGCKEIVRSRRQHRSLPESAYIPDSLLNLLGYHLVSEDVDARLFKVEGVDQVARVHTFDLHLLVGHLVVKFLIDFPLVQEVDRIQLVLRPRYEVFMIVDQMVFLGVLKVVGLQLRLLLVVLSAQLLQHHLMELEQLILDVVGARL